MPGKAKLPMTSAREVKKENAVSFLSVIKSVTLNGLVNFFEMKKITKQTFSKYMGPIFTW